MKVESNPSQTVRTSETKQGTQIADNKKAQASKGKESSAVSASLSARGQELSKAQGQVKALTQDLPEIRQDKVASLKAQINDGSYDPPVEVIAERMLQEHLP